MCVLLALLLCSVIQRWHGVGFTAMCTQCARSAHAVHTQCARSANTLPECLDHHNPPPMEKQKWGGQDSGLADLQEKIDTASCGEQ